MRLTTGKPGFCQNPGLFFVRAGYSFIRRSRSELLTTKTLLKAMAPAAIIGFNM